MWIFRFPQTDLLHRKNGLHICCLLYTSIVAKQQELSPEEVREIGVCGLLHDIGKTKIPNAILNKPGKLDDCLLYTSPVPGGSF